MNKEAQNLETQLESAASTTALGPMATVSVEIANTLMNRSPAHLVLIDQQGRIVDVNARAERLLDKSATDLRGSSPTHIFERILERVETIGPERAMRSP